MPGKPYAFSLLPSEAGRRREEQPDREGENRDALPWRSMPVLPPVRRPRQMNRPAVTPRRLLPQKNAPFQAA